MWPNDNRIYFFYFFLEIVLIFNDTTLIVYLVVRLRWHVNMNRIESVYRLEQMSSPDDLWPLLGASNRSTLRLTH